MRGPSLRHAASSKWCLLAPFYPSYRSGLISHGFHAGYFGLAPMIFGRDVHLRQRKARTCAKIYAWFGRVPSIPNYTLYFSTLHSSLVHLRTKLSRFFYATENLLLTDGAPGEVPHTYGFERVSVFEVAYLVQGAIIVRHRHCSVCCIVNWTLRPQRSQWRDCEQRTNIFITSIQYSNRISC